MKSFRSALLYLAIALLIGGYIYFFERKPVPTEADKKGKVLSGLVSDDVTVLRLEALGATRTAEKAPLVMEKDPEGVWRITAPKKYKADETTVRSALTTAGDMAPEATLKEPGDPKAYGLDRPSHLISLTLKDGKTHRLQVGSKDIQGTAYYLAVEGEKTVHLVSTGTVESMVKKLDDYRDHAFFKADPILAKRVRVTHGPRVLDLVKDEEGRWRMTSPVKGKASDDKVRNLLNSVGTLRLTAFVKDDPASLSPYGLEPPEGKFEVWLEEKGPPKSLRVGSKKKDSGDVFAKQGDLPYVVAIPGYFKTSHIEFKAEDFRDKDAMKFDQGIVDAMTLTRSGRVVSYKKDALGHWAAEGRAGAQTEASDLLADLAQTTIAEFLSSSAADLKEPSYKVEVSLTDATKRTFVFGAKKGELVALASDRGPEAYRVPAAVLTKLEACFKDASTPIPLPASSPTP
jgi:hypothetical protein